MNSLTFASMFGVLLTQIHGQDLSQYCVDPSTYDSDAMPGTGSSSSETCATIFGQLDAAGVTTDCANIATASSSAISSTDGLDWTACCSGSLSTCSEVPTAAPTAVPTNDADLSQYCVDPSTYDSDAMLSLVATGSSTSTTCAEWLGQLNAVGVTTDCANIATVSSSAFSSLEMDLTPCCSGSLSTCTDPLSQYCQDPTTYTPDVLIVDSWADDIDRTCAEWFEIMQNDGVSYDCQTFTAGTDETDFPTMDTLASYSDLCCGSLSTCNYWSVDSVNGASQGSAVSMSVTMGLVAVGFLLKQ